MEPHNCWYFSSFEIPNGYRNQKEGTLSDPRNVELLGNKALLEKRINIRASDYRFSDKATYYKGYVNKRRQFKEGTKITELRALADSKTDFVESDILSRNEMIISAFMDYLRENGLDSRK